MLEALIIGVFATAAVTLAVAAFSRAPTRARCPECRGHTEVVLLPPVLRRNQFVHMRWCPSCSWEGLGRNGPEWVRGRRIAHRSGFHWGRARFQSDFGFRFRRMVQEDQLPPHHPSGFRFAEDEQAPGSEAAHPSGFRFSGDAREPSPRPSFRWGRRAEATDFEFKESDDGKGDSDGFSWKGVA